MPKKVVPMIHVPDVRATVDWYQAIGFMVSDTYDDGGKGLSFAILSFGNTEVMFNSGGQPSELRRREVDLYVYADNVDEIFATSGIAWRSSKGFMTLSMGCVSSSSATLTDSG